MYHWYKLLKRWFNSSGSEINCNGLIYGKGAEEDFLISESFPKLFWIGFLEVLPIIIGLLLSEHLSPLLFSCDYLIISVMVSLFIAFKFRKDVPESPISIQNADQLKK